LTRRRKRPPLQPVPPAFRADAIVLLLLIVSAGLGSSLLGQDANWDMQNYHYYNPWAWWNGRIFDWDVAAAQIQTYHNPVLDFPFFAMVALAWPPRLIAFVLSIPTALAGFFVYKLAWILFGGLPARERAVAVACAVAIGTTSAMGLGTLAVTMNEWPLAMLVTFALWWLVRAQDAQGSIARQALVVGGLAMGLAAGAKLTAASFPLAMCIALLVRGPRPRAIDAAWFALGAACGIAIAYGPWGYALWTHFRNPLFPYANQWFASPWWEVLPVPGRQFGPASVIGYLLFPLALWQPPLFFVAETVYRDARLPLAYVLAIIAVVVWMCRRPAPIGITVRKSAWRLFASFCVASFVVWTIAFSILRYLLPLEALCGVIIGGVLLVLLPRRTALVAFAACTLALIVTTRIADWGRVPFGGRWFEAKSMMPTVEPDGLVLVTTGEAVSYFIPMLPPSSRYVGALNTLVKPYHESRLTEEVHALIRAHKGEFYQLTAPLTEGREVVDMHGLERTRACSVVITNMPVSPIEFCRLVRKAAAP
jgi:hypothetical protein